VLGRTGHFTPEVVHRRKRSMWVRRDLINRRRPQNGVTLTTRIFAIILTAAMPSAGLAQSFSSVEAGPKRGDEEVGQEESSPRGSEQAQEAK
jgi:hypothetical protein